MPFGVRALSTWLGCMPIAIPRIIRRDGRLTRTGRLVFVGAAVGVLVVMARSYY